MANDLKVLKTDAPPVALQKILLAHKGTLQKALAKHMDPERLIRIAVNAMHRTPSLQNCSIQSICNSVVLSGVLGLEPNTPLQHAYLIPYGRECTFQPGYRGLMHLGRRTAKIGRWRAEVVREGDEFEVEYGIVEVFRHRPKGASDNWLQCYSFAVTADGEPMFVMMRRSEVEHIRDTRSVSYQKGKAGSPWTTDFDEMAKKTVIKRHCKTLDLSIEIAQAADLDDQADTSGKQDSILDVEFQEIAKTAEEADLTTQGSRQKQEEMAEEKIEALRKQETAEEEMDRITRETVAREQGEQEQPTRRAADVPQFGSRRRL